MADKIEAAYAAGRELPPDKLREFYNDWYKAGTYDKILRDAGCEGPQEVAARLGKHVTNKEARILDIGSGTGLVAEALSKSGYINICAVDPSEESLKVCKEKGVYGEFIRCLIGPERLPFGDNTVDGAMSSAAFETGHCDGAALREMIRVVKPGGHVVIGTRRTYFNDHHDNYNLREVSDELVRDKVCTLVQEDVPNYCPFAMGTALIYCKC